METIGHEPQRERSPEYRAVVEEIKELGWENLDSKDLQRLIYLSHASAREFAAALRIALTLYPENKNLQEMAAGELQTDNMALGDYTKPGDHADYLNHFIRKNELRYDPDLELAAAEYLKACDALDAETRAMTIFSREEELPGIFQRILQARDWTAPALAEFKHYLEEHIRIDTGEGGHGDLTKDFPIDDRVKPFYEARLNMYRVVKKLFEGRIE